MIEIEKLGIDILLEKLVHDTAKVLQNFEELRRELAVATARAVGALHDEIASTDAEGLAALYHVPLDTARLLIRRGDIPSFEAGKHRRVRLVDARRYQEEHLRGQDAQRLRILRAVRQSRPRAKQAAPTGASEPDAPGAGAWSGEDDDDA